MQFYFEISEMAKLHSDFTSWNYLVISSCNYIQITLALNKCSNIFILVIISSITTIVTNFYYITTTTTTTTIIYYISADAWNGRRESVN